MDGEQFCCLSCSNVFIAGVGASKPKCPHCRSRKTEPVDDDHTDDDYGLRDGVIHWTLPSDSI